MHIIRNVLVLAVAGCVGAATVSQAQGPPPDPGRRAELLGRYDKDGDGKLSEEELATMRQARDQRRKTNGSEARTSRGTTSNAVAAVSGIRNDARIQALLEEYDRNADGKLNDDEMAALREAMRRQRARAGSGLVEGRPTAPAEARHESP